MRVYLAATDGLNRDVIKKAKPLFLLETFYAKEKACKAALDIVGKENFLLDSGAYSFMSGAKCSKELLRQYLQNYIDFINYYDITQFFELDVDTIFGIEFVEELRHELEKKTHKKCIPVWHKGRGIEYFKQMCHDYDYIAIGGLVFHVKPKEWGLIKKMTFYARQKNVKVHGLGFTKTKQLNEYAWYSVDSACWKLSAAFGNRMQKFENGVMQQHLIDGKGKKIDKVRLLEHNFPEWVKYQKYMKGKRW